MFGKWKDMLSLDKWIENFEGYMDARIDLVKYDVKEMLVDILTRSVFVLAIAVFSLAALICLNFGLAYLLNHFLGNEYAGFLILTGFYGLIALIFYLNRNNPVVNDKIETQIRITMKHPKAENPETPETHD